MSFETIVARLDSKQQATLHGVKNHAESLLNHSPRFKFFTLHGANHLNNLFEILEFLITGGIALKREELYLLSLAICVHDLGMVVSLRDYDVPKVLDGRPSATDPAALELFIRETHHELVDEYFRRDLGFLTSVGLSPNQLAQVVEISRCHRKVVLHKQVGIIRTLGAILRIIDELDLGSNRAPADVFLNIVDEMDSTSCWHWFKHNITEPWLLDHTVFHISENDRRRIQFKLGVRPTKQASINYWLNQIRRPMRKALDDDGAAQIVADHFQVQIELLIDHELSKANNLGPAWSAIEEKALSAGRKVILVIDDEFRKLEDLFYPLMDSYHVVSSPNAKDALSKLEATPVHLAIVDIQIGAGGLWKDHETQDFKGTGLNICAEIRKRFPDVKIGILTGTRHPLPPVDSLKVNFFLRKPIDPDRLLDAVNDVLS
jgi:ActR/RegA family two-component response regulator